MKQWIWMVLLACLLQACSKNGRQVDERFTLRYNDDNPFGGSVFYRLVSQQYPVETETYNLPFAKWYRDHYDGTDDDMPGGAYLIAAPHILAWEDDAEAMYDFVQYGNTLILAGDMFSEALKNKLRFQHDDRNAMDLNHSPFEPHQDGYRFLRMEEEDSVLLHQFNYYYTPFVNKLNPGASISMADTIGLNQLLSPDIVRYHIGNGTLMIITNARSLSNYFLLSTQNLRFAQSLISYLPADVDYLVYDKFYAGNPYRQPKEQSIFSAFLKHDALRWAFWLTTLAALAWLLLGLKRKQRIIPVQPANTNDSIAFTETIANLYFSRHDNKNIALKMIAHMHDNLRQRYYISISPSDRHYADMLVAKTGISKREADMLAQSIAHAQEAFQIADDELMQLHLGIRKVLQAGNPANA